MHRQLKKEETLKQVLKYIATDIDKNVLTIEQEQVTTDYIQIKK